MDEETIERIASRLEVAVSTDPLNQIAILMKRGDLLGAMTKVAVLLHEVAALPDARSEQHKEESLYIPVNAAYYSTRDAPTTNFPVVYSVNIENARIQDMKEWSINGALRLYVNRADHEYNFGAPPQTYM